MSSNTKQPRCISGQYHSAKGTAEETGAESWQRAGAEEHAQGKGEYNAAQAQGYAEGNKDRVGGRKDAVFGAVNLKGDREQEAGGALSTYPAASRSVSCNVRRDQGEMQQDVNRPS
ncbi:hypothetical protein LXA43DRAFT_1095096 [Ganoderma leucocontextum]|nr:hypothetical protein LXA43DRAFT_1095096 [Ganoderma leucocontextum]